MHVHHRLIVLTLAVLMSTTGQAQTRTTPTSPPAPRVVQGTTQLAGDTGTLGKTYTIGKGTNAINFTLVSAEYRLSRVTVDDTVYIPKADEKLLVLHYTVHNPQKVDKGVSWSTLKFTAVDSLGVNHKQDNYVGREGTTDILDMTLKPAQKIAAYAVITVPANGPIPKLIVSAVDAQGVVRYDLRGKVKPLAAPFADPADKAGVTARTVVPLPAGTYAPLGQFDLKLESFTSANTVKGETLPDSERALVAVFSLRNGVGKTAGAQDWRWNTFKIELIDADGEPTLYEEELLKVSSDAAAEGRLAPGAESRFRVYFRIPSGMAFKGIRATEGDSRSLLFTAPAAK